MKINNILFLNDDVLVNIISFVSDVPFEANADGRSTLKDVLPLVCKRFNFLCKNTDFLWKDALERLIRKASTNMWMDGIVDFILHYEYCALTSRSVDSDIDDVKDFEERTRSLRERLLPYMKKEEHEAVGLLVKNAFDKVSAGSRHTAYKHVFEWIVNHHVLLSYPMFLMRDNSVSIDASYGLHFFEPRYRLMMIEIMQAYPKGYSFGLPCNCLKKPKFFYAFHGRVTPGSEVAIVEVEQCFTHPDARADVLLTIKAFARILNSWERPNSYGLVEAQAVRLN